MMGIQLDVLFTTAEPEESNVEKIEGMAQGGRREDIFGRDRKLSRHPVGQAAAA